MTPDTDNNAMSLRAIIRYLMNTEQIITRLAESYPIRRAAQWTAYLFFKGKAIGEQRIEKWQHSGLTDRAKSFSQTLKKELEEGFEDIKKQSKK